MKKNPEIRKSGFGYISVSWLIANTSWRPCCGGFPCRLNFLKILDLMLLLPCSPGTSQSPGSIQLSDSTKQKQNLWPLSLQAFDPISASLGERKFQGQKPEIQTPNGLHFPERLKQQGWFNWLFHCCHDPCHFPPSRCQQDLKWDSGKHKRPTDSDHIKGRK